MSIAQKGLEMLKNSVTLRPRLDKVRVKQATVKR